MMLCFSQLDALRDGWPYGMSQYAFAEVGRLPNPLIFLLYVAEAEDQDEAPGESGASDSYLACLPG